MTGRSFNPGIEELCKRYKEVWTWDFEFRTDEFTGAGLEVVYLGAKELKTGKEVGCWLDRGWQPCPFPTGPDILFVGFFTSAEVGCHLQLQWPVPCNILDLYVEFKRHVNGRKARGFGLPGVLGYFNLPGMAQAEKQDNRELILRGGPWSESEKQIIQDYCRSDVIGTERILKHMLQRRYIDLPRALLRGRYMAAVARMERQGIPVDVESLDRIKENWGRILQTLVSEVDREYNVYEGVTFKAKKFEDYLKKARIHSWPRTPTGQLDLKSETFRDMSKVNPCLNPLKELRHSLGQLRLNSLRVDSDGRNRALLSPFAAKTGRNLPSSAKYIFGPATWIRSLIKPGPGMALAYIDYSQQEFLIAAALSGDKNMLEAYADGDPYLAFAKQAKAIPEDGTKESHSREREQFKTCAIGVQYSMQSASLAARINRPVIFAEELLRLHRTVYKDFWAWNDRVLDSALLTGEISTRYGWKLAVGSEANPRSLRNYPMQAGGAEILRLACILCTERGIKVAGPVHDALLVEGQAADIDDIVEATRDCMARAGEIYLRGARLRTDAEVIKYPDRYFDPRGRIMWDKIQGILGNVT